MAIQVRIWDIERSTTVSSESFVPRFIHTGDFWLMAKPGPGYKIELNSGLKDKYGVMIFEGDILRSGNEICFVRFSDSCFMCGNKNLTQWLAENADVYVKGHIEYCKEDIK